MRKIINIIFMAFIFIPNIVKAKLNEPPYIYLESNPPLIAAYRDGTIFLDKLTTDLVYTVRCDINNPNFYKQYPVIISMNASMGIDKNVKFIVNDFQPKYKQALLNKNINKYEAKGVKRSNLQGTFLLVRNYDESDSIEITNCIAIPVT